MVQYDVPNVPIHFYFKKKTMFFFFKLPVIYLPLKILN